MFNIGYFKGQPTDYVIRYTSGRATAEGPGLAFFYLRFRTQIVAVPTSSLDANFVFNEVTRDFQEVTLQGQITYRVTDPKLAAAQLNFRIDPATQAYVSEDPEKLARRVTNLAQVEARAELAGRTLPQALADAPAIAAAVADKLRSGRQLAPLGVEVQGVIILSARPTPEVGKALEAEYRESLLRQADEAIYARRASAVEEERKIKEKELATDVTLEEQRERLIVLQGANALKEAENNGVALERAAQSKAKAAEMELAVYRSMAPRELLAYAMKEIGTNAGQIGNLTITTELLAELLKKE